MPEKLEFVRIEAGNEKKANYCASPKAHVSVVNVCWERMCKMQDDEIAAILETTKEAGKRIEPDSKTVKTSGQCQYYRRQIDWQVSKL